MTRLNLLVLPGDVIEDRMTGLTEPLLVEYVQTLDVFQIFLVMEVPPREHVVEIVASEVHTAPSRTI